RRGGQRGGRDRGLLDRAGRVPGQVQRRGAGGGREGAGRGVMTHPLVHVSFDKADPAPDGYEPSRADMGLDATFRKVWCSMVDAEVEYAGEFHGWDGSHGIITRALAPLDQHPNLKHL